MIHTNFKTDSISFSSIIICKVNETMCTKNMIIIKSYNIINIKIFYKLALFIIQEI